MQKRLHWAVPISQYVRYFEGFAVLTENIPEI